MRRWLAWIAGLVLLSACSSQGDVPATRYNDGRKVVFDAWSLIQQRYVDPTFHGQDWQAARQNYLARPALTNAEAYPTIREMVHSLGDPYTRFFTPQVFVNLQTQAKGELTGIGIQELALSTSQYLQIVSPIEGSPAAKAGLLPQDIITTIDGTPTKGLDLVPAAAKLRGQAGSQVSLTIQRGNQTFRRVLTRARITINPLSYQILSLEGRAMGYLRLRAFNGNSTAVMKQALQVLEPKVAGYLLDLRLNSGGLEQSATEIARFFLPPEQIIVTIFSRQEATQTERSLGTGAMTSKPVVVLVDRGTASASEILAAALQDNHRAQLVGTRTFGKGLIQRVYSLSDGSGLSLSIAKYQTPAGRDIHGRGLVPDILAERPTLALPTTRDAQVLAASQALLSAFGHPLSNSGQGVKPS